MVGSWLVVAVLAAAAGATTAHLSNFYQQQWDGGLWQTGIAQLLFRNTPSERALFAPKTTFGEWNLFSSFLLIPFTLGLWAWRREAGGRKSLVAAVGAIVFGLVAGVTRAAWLAMVGIVALWCALRRPRAGQAATLGLMIAGALLVQALALGMSPVWDRLSDRSTMEGRIAINRATLASWRDQPVFGHGACSGNRLAVFLSANRSEKTWNGNLEMFVLHDSGVLGLATLLGLVVVVCWRTTRAIRRDAAGQASSLTVPLLIGGGALGVAYQFTHGLWLMYPYVYLGFLTAVTETTADEV